MAELFVVLLLEPGMVLPGDVVLVEGMVELPVDGIDPVEDEPVEGIAPGEPDCMPGMLPDGCDAPIALDAPVAPAEPEPPAVPVEPVPPPALPPDCANATAGVSTTAAARIYLNIFHSLDLYEGRMETDRAT